jgi:ABC-type branched-subunit amino acid transport system substrate-binding protein
MRISVRVVLGAAACSALVAACGSSGGSSGSASGIPAGPIKIGASFTLSGPAAIQGQTSEKAWKGATLAIFKKLHPHGIDGHPVVLDIQDDGGTVTGAVNAANQFVQDHVAAVAVLAQNDSSHAAQIAVLNKAHIPIVDNQPSTSYTNASQWPYYFSVAESAAMVGDSGAKYIAENPSIKRIALLTDGTPVTLGPMQDLLAKLKVLAPSVKLVSQVTTTPDQVQVSTQIAQLKASNPDLVIVYVDTGFGPIWQAMLDDHWYPKIMTSSSTWYNGFSAMEGLAKNGVALYANCVPANNPSLPAAATSAMDPYAAIFGTAFPNFLTFVASDNVPLEIIAKAIEQTHSVSGPTLESAISHMSATFFGVLHFTFTPSNHYGIAGAGVYGANACNLEPFVDGKYQQPTIAS